MALTDLKFELSYNNQEQNVIRNFLLPSLRSAIQYDRAVGFFSSTSLLSISVGIRHIVENGGKMRVVCSPKLSEEDINAIREGYEQREIIERALEREFAQPKNKFEEERLNILSHLISEGVLDIKIATMRSRNPMALFHVKLGLIYDENNNYVAFNGSMNESENGFYENGESIDVYTSFGADYLRASEKRRYFNNLWANDENNIDVIDFPQSLIKTINQYKKPVIDYEIDEEELMIYNRGSSTNTHPSVPPYIEIRQYQNDALDSWRDHGFCGIFDMATGTGKTITALNSVVSILEEKKRLGIIICCPYQHLVNQWSEDLDNFGFKYIMAFSQSRQKNWKSRLEKEIFNYNHKINDYFCLVTTNASFATPFVQKCIDSVRGEILLVVDEAHNFGTARLVSMLDDRFNYRLALSATLERHNDLVGTTKLYDFFGEKCIEYTLKMAIDARMLCKYYYYPVKVYLSDDELEEYIKLSRELRKYMIIHPDGTIEYKKQAEMILIKRARIVAGAKMKLDKLAQIAGKYTNDNHMLVYCGSATVADSDYKEGRVDNEEIRQIDAATAVLNKLGIVSSQFTSREDARKREILKKEFDEGSVIQALVAIRCLDEGVNIPSIDKAIIMASSTNPKEYIQRRGRVLRNHENKKYAVIYDFVTLPRDLTEVGYSEGQEYDLSLVKREVARVRDFADLSLNEYDSDDLLTEIEDAYGYIDERSEYDA